jgi:class 3 adenylate cyclase
LFCAPEHAVGQVRNLALSHLALLRERLEHAEHRRLPLRVGIGVLHDQERRLGAGRDRPALIVG